MEAQRAAAACARMPSPRLCNLTSRALGGHSLCRLLRCGRSHDCGLARSACIDGENGLSSPCSDACDGKRLCQPMFCGICVFEIFLSMCAFCMLSCIKNHTVHRRSSIVHFVDIDSQSNCRLSDLRSEGLGLLTIKYPHDDSSPRTCKYLSELSHHTLTNPRSRSQMVFCLWTVVPLVVHRAVGRPGGRGSIFYLFFAAICGHTL